MSGQPEPVEIPLIPASAPFSLEQCAWLNGFFAGLLGTAAAELPAANAPLHPEAVEDFPWHDPALSLDERLQLADGRPIPRKLMAAMAQLDCGQCGYLCQTYAEALATGSEASLSRCVPGGRETTRALKALLAQSPAISLAQPMPAPKRATVAARLVSRDVLNKPGSQKEVRHIALAIEGTGLTYEVGDSLGVVAENCPDVVAAICGRLGVDGKASVPCPDGVARPLAEALGAHLDIARPSDDAIALFRDNALHAEDRATLDSLLDGTAGEDLAEMDLLDLLVRFATERIQPAELAARLLPLQPRLYSISSSAKAHPGEVHLTISTVRWERRGRLRKGVASTFLADRASSGAPLQVYVQASHGFRLAPDDAPIIMIGPGTGIAPFRAFLAEREARGATGRNWLFFGDQRRATDYLYEDEIERFRARGILARLDLAFSRDQLRKVYVQDRMRENAAELWSWLGQGAYVYVCGDAQRMARDVHRALIDIAAEQGHMPLHEAEQWLAALGRDSRYRRDVY